MLTVPEEVILLSLDETTGRPLELPAAALSLALSGAVLMELALRSRLDSDPDRLFVADPTPCGDPLLDPVLARIAAAPEMQDSRWWMGQLAPGAPALRRALLERLVARGVLRTAKARRYWVLPDRRYRKTEAAGTGVRERLRAVLLAGEMPEPRDSLMAGLCRATGLLALLLSDEEAEGAAARIAAVVALEEMSRSLMAETRDRLSTEH